MLNAARSNSRSPVADAIKPTQTPNISQAVSPLLTLPHTAQPDAAMMNQAVHLGSHALPYKPVASHQSQHSTLSFLLKCLQISPDRTPLASKCMSHLLQSAILQMLDIQQKKLLFYSSGDFSV